MIILSGNYKLDADRRKLLFPAEVLSPLSIETGSSLYSFIDRVRNDDRFHLEMVTTSIPQDLWRHLWRIELATDDYVGNSALLYELLEDRGIEILFVESSINDLANYHSTHLIVTCRGYNCELDGSPSQRDATNSQKLPELERDILSYLGHKIAIPTYRSEPILKIRRMNAHRRLLEDFEQGKCIAAKRTGTVLEEGGAIQLTTKALNQITKQLRKKTKPGVITYTSSVDTKTRLLRTLFISNAYKARLKLRFLVDSESPILGKIFRTISDAEFNILQHKVNFASQLVYASAVSDHSYDPEEYDSSLRQIDLLVEPVGRFSLWRNKEQKGHFYRSLDAIKSKKSFIAIQLVEEV